MRRDVLLPVLISGDGDRHGQGQAVLLPVDLSALLIPGVVVLQQQRSGRKSRPEDTSGFLQHHCGNLDLSPFIPDQK